MSCLVTLKFLVTGFVSIFMILSVSNYNYSFIKHDIFKFRQSRIESLTRGKAVLPITSLHDQSRRFPLVSALKSGAKSIEIDIFDLGDDEEVYVLNQSSKRESLNSLYLNQLWKLFQEVNVPAQSPVESQSSSSTATTGKFGLFYNEPYSTMFIFLNVTSLQGDPISRMESYLNRFFLAGYLTYLDTQNNILRYGPLTIITTGNPSTVSSSRETADRFIFPQLSISDVLSDKVANISNFSLVASCSINSVFPYLYHSINSETLESFKNVILEVHRKGFQIRISDCPTGPERLLGEIISLLVDLNIDFIDVENLEYAEYWLNSLNF